MIRLPRFRIAICKTCYDDSSFLMLVRRCLLFGALWVCCLAVFSTIPRVTASEPDQQRRLDRLELHASSVDQWEAEIAARVAVLESHMTDTREDMKDIKTWSRGTGIAGLLVIVEKIFRAFGMSVRRRPSGAPEG